MTIAVIDTNLLVSALIQPSALPGRVLRAWSEHRRYTLATCAYQMQELREVTRRPSVAKYFLPSQAGRFINQLNALALLAVGPLPAIDVSPDPFDNFLLATAQVTQANFIVSGDKADVLSLNQFGATRIVTMRAFAASIGIT
ncbi:MAG: putative toxin-antitoxin system toxin component, PIN family [Casimicrobium sp.]